MINLIVFLDPAIDLFFIFSFQRGFALLVKKVEHYVNHEVLKMILLIEDL